MKPFLFLAAALLLASCKDKEPVTPEPTPKPTEYKTRFVVYSPGIIDLQLSVNNVKNSFTVDHNYRKQPQAQTIWDTTITLNPGAKGYLTASSANGFPWKIVIVNGDTLVQNSSQQLNFELPK